MSLHRLLLVGLTAAVSIQNLPLSADDTDAAEPTRVNRPLTAFFPGWSPTRQRIQAALDDQTNLNFADTPLIDALQYIARMHEISVVLDAHAQRNNGRSRPVNLVLSGVSLRSALKIMLPELGLDYVVRNEVMLVTTSQRAELWMVTRTYPV